MGQLNKTTAEINTILDNSIKPFLFIASNDATDTEKEMSDYVCDGLDDNIQIQTALDIISTAGGIIRLSSGVFNVDPIYPPDNISIVGAGIGKTIIKGQGNISSYSIFHRTDSNPTEYTHLDTSAEQPVIGLTMKDFEIDGTNMKISGAIQISNITGNGTSVTVTTALTHGFSTNDYVVVLDTVNHSIDKVKTVQITVIDATNFTYLSTVTNTETTGQIIKPASTNGGGKAMFLMWLKDCHFENIYAHHTPSTVIGNDNHHNCKYINCAANYGGRAATLYTNGDGHTIAKPRGCSGFGIGTSGYIEENLQIIGCTAKYNWNAGFTFEAVPDDLHNVTTSYLRFESCLAFGNTYNFRVAEASDRQSQSTIITGCYAREAVCNEVNTYTAPAGELLNNCGVGYFMQSNVDMININNCVAAYNELDGIYNDNSYADHIKITDCQIYGNEGSGIYLRGSHSVITGNHINNNDSCGIRLRPASIGIYDVIINSNNILNNGRNSAYDHGIYISVDAESIESVVISSNRIGNSSLNTSSLKEITGDGTTVTVDTYPAVHGLYTGDKINITLTTLFNASGKYVTVVNPSKFTYSDTPTGTESSGSIKRASTQDYPILIFDDIDATEILVCNNIMTGNIRSMVSTYTYADVTKVSNIE